MKDNSCHYQDAWTDALSARTIKLRKEWLSFSLADEHLVQEVDDLINDNLDELITDMYDHFLSFPETRSFFPDETTLRRAQSAQRRYFARLCKGAYDENYVAERLAVGDTHYRIGLDPTWYLGAYNRVLSFCRQLVTSRYGESQAKCFQIMESLTRLVFFDMGLAIEAYSIAKERAIRSQKDAIDDLEMQRRVTKNILEDAPLGIVRLAANLECLECNQVFLNVLGLDERSEVIGKLISEVAPNLDTEILIEVMRSGQPAKRTAEYLNLNTSKTSGSTYFDWAAWPVKESGDTVAGLVATFVDVTDSVALQQQREDFVATLTHDLKTPILAANRAIKLLIEGDFGKIEESQKRVMETIHESNDALYKMVQTLLDVYRYDSGVKKLSIGEHDLSEAICVMVTELQPLAASRGIELHGAMCGNFAPVCCDIGELRRVLQNLLDNAMKFTPAGGHIFVTMRQSGAVTEVCVRDTGKGISDEDKPKLFQRFWSAASSGRYYASTGLGLYLCRKIVELHGGKVWVESALGKGSSFYFTVDSQSAEFNRTADDNAAQ